jgi:hypothetical protein
MLILLLFFYLLLYLLFCLLSCLLYWHIFILLISHKSPLVGHLIKMFAQQKVTVSEVKSLPVKLVIVLTLTECWCHFREILVSAPICIFWFLFNIYGKSSLQETIVFRILDVFLLGAHPLSWTASQLFALNLYYTSSCKAIILCSFYVLYMIIFLFLEIFVPFSVSNVWWLCLVLVVLD